MNPLNEINRLESKLARTTDVMSAVILKLKINRLKKSVETFDISRLTDEL